MIRIGSLVTRNSYGNDVVFKVIDIKNSTYILKGVDYRLQATSDKEDLVEEVEHKSDDEDYYNFIKEIIPKDRNEYFYIPGKVLHLDGDEDYLKKCLDYYKKSSIKVVGKHVKESKMPDVIEKLVKEHNPDIVVITGHDAHYNKRIGDSSLYKNSNYFAKAVKNAKKINNNILIISGACQSDYDNLIKSGSTYASSPKRINVHALDPAVIAISLSMHLKSDDTNVIDIISKTKYKEEGYGGIITKGTMLKGYPREKTN